MKKTRITQSEINLIQSLYPKHSGTQIAGMIGMAINRVNWIISKYTNVDYRKNKTKMTDIPEYRVWANMKTRCYNSNRKYYYLYGGRGITVCERWKNSFLAFYEDMGLRPTPKHHIDRINPNGNYEPNNCRWATPLENANNKRAEFTKPSHCIVCGDSLHNQSSRKQKCHACNEYQRRNGYPRPKCKDERKRLQAEKITIRTSIPILQYCAKTNEFIAEWAKVTDAIKKYGTGVSNVLGCRVKTCKGYIFKYKNENK